MKKVENLQQVKNVGRFFLKCCTSVPDFILEVLCLLMIINYFHVFTSRKIVQASQASLALFLASGHGK